MTVWKVGCRWSKDGNAESRIISIFRRSDVVFVGNQTHIFKGIKEGDYIAIADGYTIVSVAKATGNAQPLSGLKDRLRVRPGECFDPETECDNSWGVTVRIFDLYKGEKYESDDFDDEKAVADDRIHYARRITCCRANKIATDVVRLYDSYESDEAQLGLSCKKNTLKKLVEGNVRYVIPVYQREYSWGEELVARLVRDIFTGFWGDEIDIELPNAPKMDPIFIGTMQMSFKKIIRVDSEYEQDVIDGQQRFSTLLCLFKYLYLKYPSLEPKIQLLDLLESRVNNYREDSLYREAMNLDSLGKIDDLLCEKNRYIANIRVISNVFNEIVCGQDGKEFDQWTHNLKKFVGYILTGVLFIVIETKANLSKTIRIFNTINTVGMDLNGDDLFKVRLYEYLKDTTGRDEFNEIDKIYKEAKEKAPFVNMSLVRLYFKDYLIIKYGLNKNFLEWGPDKFFERLFDAKLSIARHKDFPKVQADLVKVISLDQVKLVIGAIELWNKRLKDYPEEMITDFMVECSRYSRYMRFAVWFILQKDNMIGYKDVYPYLSKLSKIFYAYSIFYQRQVQDVFVKRGGIMESVCEYLRKCDFDGLGTFLDRTTKKLYEWLKNELGKYISGNYTWKGLICGLSAYLDERTMLDSPEKIADLKKRIYGEYDVEHIHANADGSVDVSDELQNSIGNLMLLERNINRSIKNHVFKEKLPSYKKSAYKTVQNVVDYAERNNIVSWDAEQMNLRKIRVIDEIMDFFKTPQF